MDENKDVICARCGRPIRERRRFALVLEQRPRYRNFYTPVPLGLYFHESCIKNISVKVRDLWDLLQIMNKIKGEK